MAELGVPRLIEMKDAIIDNADESLLEGFDGIEQSIYNGVNREVKKLEQADGKILFNEANLLLVLALTPYIIDSIQQSRYPSNVRTFIGQLPIIEDLNIRIHEQENSVSNKDLKKAVAGVQTTTTTNIINDLTGAGVQVEFIKPLTELIYNNVVSGSSLSDLQAAIREYIEGRADQLGQFRKYVTRISRDALYQYDGILNARIGDYFGFDAYRYVGTLIRDSRPQCIRWVGKGILLRKDMEKELAYAYNSGSGMIPGTTADNFSVYRGGYNCRHTALPIRLTDKQRSEYGLK